MTDFTCTGKIDASEFLHYASPAHARAVAWDDFDIANKDGDEFLTLAEYKKTHYVSQFILAVKPL